MQLSMRENQVQMLVNAMQKEFPSAGVRWEGGKKSTTYHQSENPTILPSQAHQIISSSSSTISSHSSGTVTRFSESNDPCSCSDDPLHPIQTPSVFTPVRRGLRLPPDSHFLPAPCASSKKEVRTPSSERVRFCLGVQAGCTNRRGARSNTCV